MFEPIRDSNGNKIISEEVKKGHKFYLYLSGEQYRRMIGHYKGGILYVKRNPDHVFVKTNSYGFNDNLLRKLPPETIVIVSEKGNKMRLKTTIKQILEEGNYLFFLSQGFEKQIFLGRSLFESIR